MYLTEPDGYYICYGCDLITEHAGMAGRIQFDKHILKCTACKNINNGPKGQKLYYIAKIANEAISDDEENNREYINEAINKAKALIKDGANVDLALLLCSDERKYRVKILKNHSRTKWYAGTLSRKLITLKCSGNVEMLYHTCRGFLNFDYNGAMNDVKDDYRLVELRKKVRSYGIGTKGIRKQELVEIVANKRRSDATAKLQRDMSWEKEHQKSILASLRAMPSTYREITPEHEWILKVERMVGLSDAAKYEFFRVSVKKGLPMLSVNKIILSYLR
ncbi:MAG: hypothetical protein Ct9H90mP28_3760 [Paracoccaceae bacterium]|nr:MAG: hypothetical protein Ct9H90mP28_3760 [Paracoccaceae bacterium]